MQKVVTICKLFVLNLAGKCISNIVFYIFVLFFLFLGKKDDLVEGLMNWLMHPQPSEKVCFYLTCFIVGCKQF